MGTDGEADGLRAGGRLTFALLTRPPPLPPETKPPSHRAARGCLPFPARPCAASERSGQPLMAPCRARLGCCRAQGGASPPPPPPLCADGRRGERPTISITTTRTEREGWRTQQRRQPRRQPRGRHKDGNSIKQGVWSSPGWSCSSPQLASQPQTVHAELFLCFASVE